MPVRVTEVPPADGAESGVDLGEGGGGAIEVAGMRDRP